MTLILDLLRSKLNDNGDIILLDKKDMIQWANQQPYYIDREKVITGEIETRYCGKLVKHKIDQKSELSKHKLRFLKLRWKRYNVKKRR